MTKYFEFSYLDDGFRICGGRVSVNEYGEIYVNVDDSYYSGTIVANDSIELACKVLLHNGYNIDRVAKQIDLALKSPTKERSHTKKDE